MITRAQMKRALVVTVVLIALAGCSLIAVACEQPSDVVGFPVLGGLSIVAAITYTVGNKPYGYLGLGDISVLVFFGWLSVAGTYYLQTHTFNSVVMLPATACGLLATAVLNINNLRDIESDRENGKNTLAVRLGPHKARIYHALLLGGAVLCFALFTLFISTARGAGCSCWRSRCWCATACACCAIRRRSACGRCWNTWSRRRCWPTCCSPSAWRSVKTDDFANRANKGIY